MKSRRLMMRVGFTATIAGVLLTSSLVGSAATTVAVTAANVPDVFITEVQVTSADSAGEEFVEFYNNTDHDIDFADTANGGKDLWKLQYYTGTKFDAVRASATAAEWATPSGTITLSGVIPAHDYYVLASTVSSVNYAPGGIDADQQYSPHLSANTAVQLVDVPSTSSMVYHDRLLWSDDTAKQGGATAVQAAPSAGSSLQRLPSETDTYFDEAGDPMTFTQDSTITPKDVWAPAPVVEETQEPEVSPVEDQTTSPGTGTNADSDTPTDTPSDATTDTTSPVTDNNKGLLPLQISELLPNPASPATDDKDEFIELFNPNETEFNLKGYTLEVGATTKHRFTFTSDTVIAALSYMAFTSELTGLSLSNSSGQAWLRDPAEVIVAQSTAYSTAKDGQSWVFDKTTDSWQWTTTPTSGEANVITAVLAAATKSTTKTAAKGLTTKAAKTTSSKLSGAKTTKSAKPKAAKKAKAKKAPKKKKTTVVAQTASTKAPPKHPIHPAALAVVAVLVVAYGLYEYRHDVANRIYQFRKHRAARSGTRFAVQGR